jgi:O-antigen ligase
LGFGAAALTLLWLAPRHLWQGTLLIFGVVLLAFFLWINGRLPTQVVQRVTDFSQDFTGFRDVRGVVISDENFAVVERLAHWQSALAMAETRPWLGVGFGNYEAAYPEFALINWPIALGHAHNYYLNLLAETGILGLTIYGIMWSAIFVMTWRVLQQTELLERGVALGLMGVWIHLAVHSLVDKIYVNNSFLHFGVMLGLLAVLQHQIKNRNQSAAN